MIQDHDRIEFAIYILTHPEESGSPAVLQWLAQADNRKLLEQLRFFLEAGLRLEKDIVPDVERRLEKFMRTRKIRMRRKLLRTISIAASVVLFIGGIVFWQFIESRGMEKAPETVVTAESTIVPGKKQAVLITESGKQIYLGDGEQQQVNVGDGIRVDYDSVAGIRYETVGEEIPACHTLKVPVGGEYQLTLSDGTTVWLNSGSELKYPVRFGEKIREVELKGEAYFEVSKDKTKPFIVLAGGVSTRVYGTEFNIRSYGEEEVNVTLVKGSISVKNESLKQEHMLEPGENACLAGNDFRVEKVNVRKYTAWKEGYFYYENECLDQILKDLKRWYDFDVVYTDNKLGSLRFEFWSTRHESIETVVRTLTRTNRIDVKMDGMTLIVSEANRLK